MTFSLLSRTQHARTYQNDANPQEKMLCLSHAALHYEGTPDSGAFDSDIDLTPQRINNSLLDGWIVNANGWHFALGKPKDPTNHFYNLDGTIGFGGRQGEHWLYMRLVNAGYLHATDLAFDSLGTPNYANRASNLSSSTHALTIGPNADSINVETLTEWHNIYTAPGGGEAYLRFRMDGDQLKLEPVVNQALRTWLEANHPPATPASETYFTFLLELDWSDIPQRIINGIQKVDADDWDDTNGTIELRDAADKLLAFLPLDSAYVLSTDASGHSRRVSIPLKKRFYQQNGKTYLAVGALITDYLTLPDGDLVFDPTFAVSGTNDDGNCVWGTSSFLWDASTAWAGNWNSHVEYAAAMLRSVTVPNGATISSATGTFVQNSGTDGTVTNLHLKLAAQAIDSASQPSSSNLPSGWTYETGTNYDPSTWVNNTSVNIDLTSDIQTLVNRAGWASGNNINLALFDRGTTSGSTDAQIYDYTDSAAKAFSLAITYSAGTDTSDNQAAYTAGQDSASDNQPGYLGGQDTAADNQASYLGGQDSAADNQPVYASGQDATVDNQAAYTGGQDSASDNQPSYLGGQDGAVDNQSSYLGGQDSTLSHVPAWLSGEMAGEAVANQAAYLHGADSTLDNQPAYLGGESSVFDSQALYLAGEMQGAGQQPVFMQGGASASDHLAGYTLGGLSTSHNQPGYLYGNAAIAAHQAAYIRGAGTILPPTERLFTVAGDNRTASVAAEPRTVQVGAESRTFKVNV